MAETEKINTNFQVKGKSPFSPTAKLNETTINFISNWFEEEIKYVFFLDIMSYNDLFNVTRPAKFIFTMNGLPKGEYKTN